MNLPGFNAGELQTWLQNTLNERQTGLKIQASPAVTDETRNTVTEYLYERRQVAGDEATADEILRRVGPEQALALWRNPPADLPGAVRIKLLRSITRDLAQREAAARQAQDTGTAEELSRRQGEVWDEALPQITDMAQSMRAMEDMLEMSPDAQVARARRQMDQAAGAEMDRRRPETDQVRAAVNEGRQAGVEAVRQDPQVNDAARAAVDAAVAESPEVKQAVVMELAEPWASVPSVLAHAREQVRAKVDELMNRQPRPEGLTAAQHARRIMDDLAGRAAGIFAGHIQGADPGVDLVTKYMQRLGLTREKAASLATAMSREWDRQLKAAQAKLPKRIAAARVARERNAGTAPEATAGQVDAAIRRGLADLNTRLGTVLREEAGRREGTGLHVAERIVQASGLTGEAADRLRNTLQQRWDALVTDAQRRALEGMQRRSGVKVTRPVRGAFEKLLELDRLGALTSERFYGIVRDQLKLKRLTHEDASTLRRLVREAQAAPAGFQRQRLQAKVLTFTDQLAGKVGWTDFPLAVWFANIFSGPMTHVANNIGNGTKLLETIATEILHRPVAAGQILRAAARGAEKGGLEASSVMRTGGVEGTRILKAEAARPLEALHLPGAFDYLLTPWRLVGRALAAEDLAPFKVNEEVKWTLMARRVARAEGLPMWGDALNRRVQEILHNTETDRNSARTQAAAEGLSGMDLWRRTREILEQRREEEMPGSQETGRNYALKQTYNAEPYGLVGQIAQVLNFMNRSLVVTRFAVPVVRIMANVLNESLNYFPPVGLARVALAKWGPSSMMDGKVRFRNRLDGRPITDPDAMWNATAQAAVGTALFGALAVIGAQSLESEDPPVAIYGQGPRTRTGREQLRSTGWIPNSIKIGNRYYSYQETQLAIPLAILGNYFDALRWKNLDQADALNRVAYAMQTFSDTLLDRRMLSGVSGLIDAMHASSEKQGGVALTRFLGRVGSSFVVPNAVRWVDQVFDPTIYDANGVQGELLQQVPWARAMNRPALNAFGEEIKRGPWERFTAPAKPDELVRALAAKSAWVPQPNPNTMTIGDRSRGPEYYRPITPEEYHQFILETGPAIRQELEGNLDRIALDSPEEVRAYVRRVANREHAKALPQF